MLPRTVVGLVIALVASLALAASAAAKMNLSSSTVPGETTAGEPFEVTFTIEDHDGRLTEASEIIVFARPSGVTAAPEHSPEVYAEPVGDPYHWRATMTIDDPGAWTLVVTEKQIGFRQDLATIDVAVNPAAAVTYGQFDSALSATTTEFDKQLSGLSVAIDTLATQVGEIDTLQQQIANLASERDRLNKQIADLHAAQSARTTDDSTPWWLAAILGAAAAITVMAAGYVASRRGFVRRRALAPAGQRN